MGGSASSTTAEIYMQAYECTAITTALHPPKVWERFVDDVYSILKCTHLENLFHHINNIHPNIMFTMEEESNGELALMNEPMLVNEPICFKVSPSCIHLIIVNTKFFYKNTCITVTGISDSRRIPAVSLKSHLKTPPKIKIYRN